MREEQQSIYISYGKKQSADYLNRVQSVEEQRKEARRMGDRTYLSVRERAQIKAQEKLREAFEQMI